MRATVLPITVVLGVLAIQAEPRLAHAQPPAEKPQTEILPEPRAKAAILGAPRTEKPPEAVEPNVPSLLEPPASERVLPINLATALRLADARPLVIEAARAAVETEYGLLRQARALWLPDIYLGVDYQRHDGALQNFFTGGLIIGPRNQFLVGGGAQAVFALTDAIYSPLAARQLLNARNIDIQTAKNEALLAVALAYFDVQQARGILAGSADSVAKAHELARRVGALGRGLAAAVEVERVRATLADLEQQAASARQDWEVTSAALTRVLRLDPAAVVVPLEPPNLRTTVVSPKESVDALIVIGLTSRPELASQQAVVQAALVRLRQEKMRPLIPSLVLQSNAVPDGQLGAGAFGSGTTSLNNWAGRSDWDAEVVWQLKNLGLGNLGLVAQRRGEQRQAVVELFRVQDTVAAEVRQAHAQVQAAAVRVTQAEAGLKAAAASYQGNLRGLAQTVRSGDLLVLVNRPQEVVAALQQLQQAYVNYYTTSNDFNRAEFRLFRALGYPAQGPACGGAFGTVVPVDPSRPAPLPPVHAPEPCQDCPR